MIAKPAEPRQAAPAFVEAFGEAFGARYQFDGLTLPEAEAQFRQYLLAQHASLQQRLAEAKQQLELLRRRN